MSIRDLALTLTASILIGAFLIPTLINTKKFDAIPNSYAVLFIGLPALALIGMFVIKQLSKKLALLWQVAKFALVGVLNTAIDFGILNLLILITGFTAGAGIGIINIPSFTLAILNSYIWNRKWVFENAKQGNFFVFVAVTVIGLLINTTVVVVVTTWIPPLFGLSPTLWANVAKVFATGFSMVWNFTGYKLVVFKR
ncbi:hypothetical protein A3D04_03640 [Candidatus Curtissbacteria bacterium RIFCSPHIGHO2_02_FULL_40_16b]|uniref:GtrA/DPMS transmembrane domain-containing protein n=1 Tax=Candidatus Curtissbacteria bacterium RIFCSPHIGHO2_02_FULL_40_16b TaxID=1797714 RepID=A0A1F5GBR6_9BACT|nr:hypothetical protein [uncultured bacterium]OGD89285.1 MAG: hypothetical protein A3D04_03640 [Candidatus Curtissbacteria bacterium RIFCSPHIGHO2_02_FULL_40_16b]